MTGDRMRRVSELLEQALALEDAARGSFLDAACAGDADLRTEVESLIASHQRAGSRFLNELPPLADDRRRESGRRIGPYLVVARIGAGGMGDVFAAVRADGQYEQKVALKLVRAGYAAAADIVERFRAERQILAGLDHPNIARLLDGGTTDDGAPYLVMELVDGVPIDDYCVSHDLPIAERLRLFLDVCAAVQYAHQRLVIHRDLKARNILVTAGGVPKLLDFGIAKMLDPSGGVQDTMLRPFTPEYASPEQVRGEPVSTASDVYSLGVVLYHLLTGRSPYRLDTQTTGELADAIVHREPERPSTAVTREARNADVAPTRLQRQLRGDLDVILLKALRKEPEKRYASVEQFAEDVRRHLNGHPVLARHGTWSYRAGKFAQRHRTSVAAAALVLLTLIGGIVLTLREARVARRQAAIASTERARAEKRFNDVRKLSDSLIFDVHDAIQSLPGATPARKLLLDRAVEYLDSVSRDAEGDPDLERELAWGYQRLAVVQGSPSESNLGDLQAALASDRKALALFERVAVANSQDTIDQLNVAMMHRILAYSTLTDASGRRDLETAMGITARLLAQGTKDPRVRSERSIEFQNLAFVQDAAGERIHALDSYRMNQHLKLDILRTNPDYRGLQRGLGMSTVLLGSALARVGRRDESLRALDQGIGYYESLQQQEPDAINVARELAISRQKRGDVLLMNADLAGALAVYREVRRVLEPMAQADPQNAMLQLDLAGIDFHEARALVSRGAYDEAISKLQRAVDVFERLDQTRSADDAPRGSGAIYIWLGDAFAGRKDFRSALRSDEHATSALTAALERAPDDDTRCELAVSYIKRANVLAATSLPHDAAAAYQKALDIVGQNAVAERQDVPALYVIADAYAGLGSVRIAEARQTQDPGQRSTLVEQARQMYERSVTTWKQIPNPARISPSGYSAGDPMDVSQRLAGLRARSGQDPRTATR